MTVGRRLIAVAIACVALSGCGDDDGGDVGEARPQPDRIDRIPAERRQAPPAGVAEQVSYYEIGNGGCPTKADAPSIRFVGLNPRVVEINHGYLICLLGFASERVIEVTIRRPDGREVLKRVDPEGQVSSLSWSAVPLSPIGRYDVTARQGSVGASNGFRVRRASTTSLLPIEKYVAPGEPVRLGFAGFPPREAVRFHLYRESGSDRYSYLTSMTARMDENGEAIYEIATNPASPPVSYLARVTKRAQGSFSVQEPPED